MWETKPYAGMHGTHKSNFNGCMKFNVTIYALRATYMHAWAFSWHVNCSAYILL